MNSFLLFQAATNKDSFVALSSVAMLPCVVTHIWPYRLLISTHNSLSQILFTVTDSKRGLKQAVSEQPMFKGNARTSV
jgi:hypothetical protein